MNILEIIMTKISLIPEDKYSLGIKAVILHIETAEKYFLRAKEDNDDNLFTDVIYRTNHAFEGILKEAYNILAHKDSEKTSPYEIEKYLSTNNVFKERVLELFTNYRTEWRNTSTHDYKLFFTEQEAFLAIINVSAFVNILLDQIIEKINFDLGKARTEKETDKIKNNIEKYNELSFVDKILSLFKEFGKKTYDLKRPIITEIELSGLLAGFIMSIEPDIEIEAEPYLNSNRTLRPDFIIKKNNASVIVEVKRSIPTQNNISRAKNQVLTYLLASKIEIGILLFMSPGYNDEPKVEKEIHLINNLNRQLYIVYSTHRT